jgi:hypothetical protein
MVLWGSLESPSPRHGEDHGSESRQDRAWQNGDMTASRKKQITLYRLSRVKYIRSPLGGWVADSVSVVYSSTKVTLTNARKELDKLNGQQWARGQGNPRIRYELTAEWCPMPEFQPLDLGA